MSGSTDKILQALGAEQIRRLNLTKEDLQKSYRKLAEQNFPDDQRIRFIADLGACKDAAYHYRLICKDKKLHLESSFHQHGREGLAFLFEQLDTVRDEKLKILTAFLIAETLSKLKHRDFYVSFCDRLIPVLVSLIDTNENILRRKIIIAFGWIGSSKEIDILTRQISRDKDALCRAWSAASLMQMSFYRVEREMLRTKTKEVFAQAIAEEKDLYACGMMIEAAQTLFSKKWISSTAVENMEPEKIEKARQSTIRFLSKC